MIHDATVEVTCDRNNASCSESEYIELNWHLGGYDDDDKNIEKKLVQRGWIVENGKHYCCEEHVQC